MKTNPKAFTNSPSSRRVSVRDIGRFFIPRTTTLRGDERGVKGFTLIELLVVVLIIGILSAVALPQYQKAVERAKMTEAITNLRAIANANLVYYMANGEYAEEMDLGKLDVNIPGTVVPNGGYVGRVATKDFLYSPNGNGNHYLALAKRINNGDVNTNESFYFIYMFRNKPNIFICYAYSTASSVQKKLCDQITANGTL